MPKPVITVGIVMVIFWTVSFIIGIVFIIKSSLSIIIFLLYFAWVLIGAFASFYQLMGKGKPPTAQTEKESILENIIKRMPVPVVVIKGKYIHFINTQAVKMLNALNAEQIIRKDVCEFIEVESNPYFGFFKQLQKSPKEKKQGTINAQLNRLNDNTIDVEISYSNISIQRGQTFLLIIKELSTDKESLIAFHRAEQLSMLEELSAGIAHEIRNPMTSLKGFIQLMKDNEEENCEYSEVMLSEIDRINEIVGELLFLSKPRELKIEQVSLLPLLKSVITLANTQAMLYNIKISFLYDHALSDLLINGDENKLKHVFINLLKNAIEAMPYGGNIYINMKKAEENVVVSIIDEGEGIVKDEIGLLSNQFHSTKEKGTGLGLMMCFNIVEDHGGKINFQNSQGKGTIVEVVLPI